MLRSGWIRRLFPRSVEIALVLSIAACLQAQQELRLPSVLASHMVVQQGKPITLWGKAGPRDSIIVRLRNPVGQLLEKKKTWAGEDGSWSVSLAPRNASFQRLSIAISDSEQRLLLSDVLVGEVWLAAGQSNMQLGVPYILGGTGWFTTLTILTCATSASGIFPQVRPSRSQPLSKTWTVSGWWPIRPKG